MSETTSRPPGFSTRATLGETPRGLVGHEVDRSCEVTASEPRRRRPAAPRAGHSRNSTFGAPLARSTAALRALEHGRRHVDAPRTWPPGPTCPRGEQGVDAAGAPEPRSTTISPAAEPGSRGRAAAQTEVGLRRDGGRLGALVASDRRVGDQRRPRRPGRSSRPIPRRCGRSFSRTARPSRSDDGFSLMTPCSSAGAGAGTGASLLTAVLVQEAHQALHAWKSAA